MPQRILAQVALAANTDTEILSGLLVEATTVTCVSVCNRSNTVAAFRLWVRTQGSVTATNQYEFYDYTILQNDAPKFTWGVDGLGLTPGDYLYARADTANITVTVHGK